MTSRRSTLWPMRNTSLLLVAALAAVGGAMVAFSATRIAAPGAPEVDAIHLGPASQPAETTTTAIVAPSTTGAPAPPITPAPGPAPTAPPATAAPAPPATQRPARPPAPARGDDDDRDDDDDDDRDDDDDD